MTYLRLITVRLFLGGNRFDANIYVDLYVWFAGWLWLYEGGDCTGVIRHVGAQVRQ